MLVRFIAAVMQRSRKKNLFYSFYKTLRKYSTYDVVLCSNYKNAVFNLLKYKTIIIVSDPFDKGKYPF